MNDLALFVSMTKFSELMTIYLVIAGMAFDQLCYGSQHCPCVLLVCCNRFPDDGKAGSYRSLRNQIPLQCFPNYALCLHDNRGHFACIPKWVQRYPLQPVQSREPAFGKTFVAFLRFQGVGLLGYYFYCIGEKMETTFVPPCLPSPYHFHVLLVERKRSL